MVPGALALMLAVAASVMSGGALHATDRIHADRVYLAIPGVDGGSEAVGHEGEIELSGWHWVTRSAGSSTGSGRVRAAVCTSLFEVLKPIDAATVPLLLAHFQNRSYGQAILSIVRAGVEGVREAYLVIELENVLVAAVDSGALDESGQSIERVALRFESATLAHADGAMGTVSGGSCP